MAAEAGEAEAIRKRGRDARFALPNYDRLAEELPTRIFCGLFAASGTIEEGKKLKWDSFDGGGRGAIDCIRSCGFRIMVTNRVEFSPVPMAEHTMGLLLALARKFPDSVRGQDPDMGQQEIWDSRSTLTELNGKVLLIVGYGSIGRESGEAGEGVLT